MNDMLDDLIKTIDRICDRHCEKPALESAEAGEWPVMLWQALDEVGLTRAALREEDGGPGLGFGMAMEALRRCAYHCAPVPLAETMLAGRMLAAAGLEIPGGALTIAPTRVGDNLRMVRHASGLTLWGTAHRVPWGDHCPHAVVVAECEGKTMVGLAPTADAVRSVEKTLAGEPRAHLQFYAIPVVMAAELPGGRQRLETEGALYRSVQMAGALERILEYSLRYANERVQFGRPIGKFQAVQHMLAVLAGQLAVASASANAAVEASSDEPHELLVSVAKARTGEAAGKGAEIAHQVHGAMGYTREHNLHYSSRRLWAWREEFGNETYWQGRVGKAVAVAGANALWPMLTAL